MGNVLIVRNNNKSYNIYTNAQQSYANQKVGFYNTIDNTPNEECVKRIKNDFTGNGFILFMTYDYANPTVIEDVFIGSEVEINEKNNIKYIMRIHLTREHDERTINSIIDKIDLDISRDFESDCFVIMSNMDSLYNELQERVVARKPIKLEGKCTKAETEEETYCLSDLAQKDTQAVRIYPNDELGSLRTEFQRDREKVVNCKAFRRLVDKAQIFGSEKGDYY